MYPVSLYVMYPIESKLGVGLQVPSALLISLPTSRYVPTSRPRSFAVWTAASVTPGATVGPLAARAPNAVDRQTIAATVKTRLLMMLLLRHADVG